LGEEAENQALTLRLPVLVGDEVALAPLDPDERKPPIC
jgi:hypothetical protein